MDNRRFDIVVKSFAEGNSRRSLLKGLLGFGGAAIVGSTVAGDTVDAARRAPRTPPEPSCPGQQSWNGTACVCPPGLDKCGPDCCPSEAQCCDNACCFGTCYAEELCCETPSVVCADNTCRPESGCCSDDECADCHRCHHHICVYDENACEIPDACSTCVVRPDTTFINRPDGESCGDDNDFRATCLCQSGKCTLSTGLCCSEDTEDCSSIIVCPSL